mmetsp:Transcript_35359/g.55184  ORF Transcript_35359/g.55184 Transcript_35359/m.55184 type:complete len:93 (-) Transcript_35359:2-280(-)
MVCASLKYPSHNPQVKNLLKCLLLKTKFLPSIQQISSSFSSFSSLPLSFRFLLFLLLIGRTLLYHNNNKQEEKRSKPTKNNNKQKNKQQQQQ